MTNASHLGYLARVANDQQVALRLPREALVRADRLAKQLSGRSEFAAFRVTRSAVLRLAVLNGLAQLEQESKR